MSQCKAANFFGSSFRLSQSTILCLRNGVHVLDLLMHVCTHAENSHPINVGTQAFAYKTTSLQFGRPNHEHTRQASIVFSI